MPEDLMTTKLKELMVEVDALILEAKERVQAASSTGGKIFWIGKAEGEYAVKSIIEKLLFR